MANAGASGEASTPAGAVEDGACAGAGWARVRETGWKKRPPEELALDAPLGAGGVAQRCTNSRIGRPASSGPRRTRRTGGSPGPRVTAGSGPHPIRRISSGAPNPRAVARAGCAAFHVRVRGRRAAVTLAGRTAIAGTSGRAPTRVVSGPLVALGRCPADRPSIGRREAECTRGAHVRALGSETGEATLAAAPHTCVTGRMNSAGFGLNRAPSGCRLAAPIAPRPCAFVRDVAGVVRPTAGAPAGRSQAGQARCTCSTAPPSHRSRLRATRSAGGAAPFRRSASAARGRHSAVRLR